MFVRNVRMMHGSMSIEHWHCTHTHRELAVLHAPATLAMVQLLCGTQRAYHTLQHTLETGCINRPIYLNPFYTECAANVGASNISAYIYIYRHTQHTYIIISIHGIV